jgi:phosphopantetheinyl transferase
LTKSRKCRASLPPHHDKERWGRPYIDNRDWSIYSERLVERGIVHLSIDFIDQWDDQLSQMNAGERGRPFLYPERFIEWMARIRALLQMPYRQMEGFVRKLAEFIPHLKAAGLKVNSRRETAT